MATNKAKTTAKVQVLKNTDSLNDSEIVKRYEAILQKLNPSYYIALKKEKKEQSERSKLRSSTNKDGRIRICNFNVVNKDYKINILGLPSNVKQSRVTAEQSNIERIVKSLLTDSQIEKFDTKTLYFERLPKLLSNHMLLKVVGLTPNQLENCLTMVFSTTKINDMIYKGLTMSPIVYNKRVEQCAELKQAVKNVKASQQND